MSILISFARSRNFVLSNVIFVFLTLFNFFVSRKSGKKKFQTKSLSLKWFVCNLFTKVPHSLFYLLRKKCTTQPKKQKVILYTTLHKNTKTKLCTNHKDILILVFGVQKTFGRSNILQASCAA